MEGQQTLPNGEILSFGKNLVGVQVYAIIKEVGGERYPVFIRRASEEERSFING